MAALPGCFSSTFASRLFARNYEDPMLVSCTDGVGTKLKVATLVDRHDTVGIDLVAMSVNDALCCGAEPLFFLDYIAMSHDDPDLLEQIVRGISNGCVEADCALLGGETAIMPDLYARGDYDLAGFLRRRRRAEAPDRRQVDRPGRHGAGHCVQRPAQQRLQPRAEGGVRSGRARRPRPWCPELNQTVGEALLTPTRIYTRPIRRILQHYKVKNVVHGIAHITGGGLRDNLERILPEGVRAVLDRGSWPCRRCSPGCRRLGGIDDDEMERVFNMGIGLVLVFNPHYEGTISRMLSDAGLAGDHWKIGEIASGPRSVAWRHFVRWRDGVVLATQYQGRYVERRQLAADVGPLGHAQQSRGDALRIGPQDDLPRVLHELRLLPLSFRSEQLGQQRVGGDGGAFGKHLGGRLAAALAGFGRVGNGPRIAQHKLCQTRTMSQGELPGDIAPHGEAAKGDGCFDSQSVEQCRHVVGHLLHRRRAGNDLAGAKAPQVRGDHAADACQAVDLPLPHGVVEWIAVDEHQRRALAAIDGVETDGSGLDERHGRILLVRDYRSAPFFTPDSSAPCAALRRLPLQPAQPQHPLDDHDRSHRAEHELRHKAPCQL
jgi:phosphoribosylformylglycinamidine cyclo-ligase